MATKSCTLAAAAALALVVPNPANALCFFNCPPSSSAVVSDLAGRAFRPMGQVIRVQTARFVDSQEANFMGIPVYRATLHADFVFPNGESLGRPQEVNMTYEKRNSGWVLVGVTCNVCYSF
jgi:hypothetical protein